MEVSINKDFCGIVMSSQKGDVSKFNQYMNSNKMPCIIYADLESLIKKIDRCANNPEKSSTTKTGKHVPCRCSLSTIWVFDIIENKHALYSGKDPMKKICSSLKERALSLYK